MRTVEENKKLCEEMPFLIPRSRWDGNTEENYDYTYTELDSAEIPESWNSLVLNLCREITPILKKADFLDKLQILQIKEKYGSLCFYTNGIPKEIYSEFYSVVRKYEQLSAHTCINCGSTFAKRVSVGWIEPYCKQCWERHNPDISFEEATEEPW